MDYDLAKQKLMIHGSFISNHDEWSESFLGLLKPYRRRIDDAVFENILECLKAVFPLVNTAQAIDSQIVTGVQGILHYGRAWVLDENSGLRQSGRISIEEVSRIEGWLNVISEIYTYMLWIKTEEQYLFGDHLQKLLTRRSTSLPSVAGRCAIQPRSAG